MNQTGSGKVPHRLVLCTGNPGKQAELRALLPRSVHLLSLADVRLPSDLPETGSTLEANALQKARYAFERCGLPCVADDTGLEVEALGGAPGVYSARYAGEARDPALNMTKLLRALNGVADRRARFRTVLAFVDAHGEWIFEGEVQGTITSAARGSGGFGYDPIFMPEGSTLTFAEMGKAEKNAISHRGHAVARLVDFLERYFG
ncbi:MAG: RdgB/HAM1 family non-canonical purine NTP pyrophosphatase [Flavobacteriales bacterium]|nr:RdgB/HAM1 family non-canonical purine NTP pyrophosphatase [Flavobacteriales bacterium]